MTPTRSSRRYVASKGKTPLATQLDRPVIPMVPAANQAVSGYPLSSLGMPAAYDLVLRSRNNPDRGATLPE